MSGIEAAGLALGAIPVILEGYRMASDRIQDFTQAIAKLKVIAAQFHVCKLNFLSECRLLLDMVLSDTQISHEMVADTQHDLWQDNDIRKQLLDLLGEHLEACVTIISDTKDTVNAFDARLSDLLEVSPKSKSGNLRTKIAFMNEKKRFDRDIATLRRRNADLNLLRSHFSARDTSSWSENTAPSGVMNKVKRLATIRLASGVLYETLSAVWSCSDKTHGRHWVKLCVGCDSKPKTNSVALDLAFSSEIAQHQRPGSSFPTVWVLVRSESNVDLKGKASDSGKQEALDTFVRTLQQSSSTQAASQSPMINKSTVMAPVENLQDLSKSIDICKLACVCSHFRSRKQVHGQSLREHCLGYIQPTCDSRYLFFGPSAPGSLSTMGNAVHSTEEAVALKDIIEQPQYSRLQLLHQYQLALKIAESVLQFHNTAWLAPLWRSEDLSIVGSSICDQSLNTLHLSKRFEAKQSKPVSNSQATTSSSVPKTDDTSSPISAVDACCKKLCPGVYNETLFCLGIVLLEIAHWQTFEKMRQGDPDEFYAAHRIVRGPPPLGQRYRKIVERCLRCDFGVASEDLEDVELQQAVWSKVIYPLETLVRDISQEA